MIGLVKSLVKVVLSLPFRTFDMQDHSDEGVTRFYLYRRLAEVGERLGGEMHCGRALSISGSQHLGEVIGLHAGTLISADYPEHNVLGLGFEDDSFDVVLFDMVLEHIEGSPQDAIDELRRVLKPGGILFCTTVLFYPIHAYPSDFWRFTPEALKLLCRRFSGIIDLGGWGNLYVWFVIWLGLGKQLVPLKPSHPLHKVATRNDDHCKIVTWVVARK
jgi:SAM-dependent methyltransferase